MKLVIVESPLAGDVERNVAYAKDCLRDCLKRGEAPFASHLLYAQPGILDDTIPEEREIGILAGLAWGAKADLTVVYIDHGISAGMRLGIEDANASGRPHVYRTLQRGESEATLNFRLTFKHKGEHEHFEPSKGSMSFVVEAADTQAATFFGERLAKAMSEGQDVEVELESVEPEVPDDLERALETARNAPPMSNEEREEQRRSFAYGNTHLDNKNITRELVDRVADDLKKEGPDGS